MSDEKYEGLEWSGDEELILKKISEKCFSMSEFHKKKYIELQNTLKYYKIPVIIISGINSVIAVGMSDYLPQNVISATNCVLALICGIIGSVELYLKISDNMNSEFVSGRDFYLLHIDINKTLALSRPHREVAGDIYLSGVYSKYIKTVSGAQIMTGHNLIHDFDEKIPNIDIKVENPTPKHEESIEMVNVQSIADLERDLGIEKKSDEKTSLKHESPKKQRTYQKPGIIAYYYDCDDLNLNMLLN